MPRASSVSALPLRIQMADSRKLQQELRRI